MDASFEIQVLIDTVKLLQARVAELEALLRRVSGYMPNPCRGCGYSGRNSGECTCGQWELTAAIEAALEAK